VSSKVICPKCQAENYATDAVCMSCGENLKQQAGPARPPAPQPGAPRAPVPPIQPVAPAVPRAPVPTIQPSAPTVPGAATPVQPGPVAAPVHWGGNWDFNAQVKSRGGTTYKGGFKVSVTPQGLRFRQGKKHDFVIPVGAPARYLDKNRFTTQVGTETIDVTVQKFGAYQERMTQDVVSFVTGKVGYIASGNYVLPWYLYIFVVLPIGIPILTLGGALWGALGFGLASANFAIAQNDKMPPAARLAITAALTFAGYGLIFLLGIAVLIGKLRG
jgi:hypothetical protein